MKAKTKCRYLNSEKVVKTEKVKTVLATIEQLKAQRKALAMPDSSLESILSWAAKRNEISIGLFRARKKLAILQAKESRFLPYMDEYKIAV